MKAKTVLLKEIRETNKHEAPSRHIVTQESSPPWKKLLVLPLLLVVICFIFGCGIWMLFREK